MELTRIKENSYTGKNSSIKFIELFFSVYQFDEIEENWDKFKRIQMDSRNHKRISANLEDTSGIQRDSSELKRIQGN